MKKCNYLVFALCLAGALLFTSCNKNEENLDGTKSSGKKVSAIVNFDNENVVDRYDSTAFIYNDDGNLIKTEDYKINGSSKLLINSMEFSYISNKVVTITSYEWDGTTKTPEYMSSVRYDSNNKPAKVIDFDYYNRAFVMSDTLTITYNSDNLPIKYESSSEDYFTCEYTNNNLTKVVEYFFGEQTTYEFNFDSYKNPFKGSPVYFFEYVYNNTNNYTSRTCTDETENVTYEYDSDGYPTKAIIAETYLTSSNHLKKAGSTYTSVRKIYYM